MNARQSAGVAIFGAALVLTGIGFLGLGINLALQTVMAPAAAAVLTGGLLLIAPALWLATQNGKPAGGSSQSEPIAAALVTELANLAARKPLLAVVAAAAIGVVAAVTRKR